MYSYVGIQSLSWVPIAQVYITVNFVKAMEDFFFNPTMTNCCFSL